MQERGFLLAARFSNKNEAVCNNANSHCPHPLVRVAYALASIMLVIKTDFGEILTILTSTLPTRKAKSPSRIYSPGDPWKAQESLGFYGSM